MVLQASGAISLADLRDEFGDESGSVQLSRYYKGTEGEVPPSYAGSNPNVPTSGGGSSISLNDFYGAQNIWATTITSTALNVFKVFTTYGYDRDIAPFAGDDGDVSNDGLLYNLGSGAKLQKATSSDILRDVSATCILQIQVTGGTAAERLDWNRITVTNQAGTSITLAKSDFTSITGGTFSYHTGVSTHQYFVPEGSNWDIIFDTES